ncbi:MULTISPECIES: FAD-dependent monooxygenase [Streptomyces]|uniref:2-polyprenyl-6-methoxyphenol hydroxylase-like FAD-dependent oxidoreductase n=1 Tax=Streptomyces demainii TaxID=588122 RepID=A0ABT9L3T2_9ACTN|nr:MULTISPECIES: FAD-dependent monooxygenase [Streptomyces]MDP9615327.1 2-polyprenyl-6-methoxyphenol hydroxylase-like FAD-dependent oxidoreductase [Streptomyces demainii]
MTTALIIGGGIAGTVTAMALRKAGIDAVVYEAYPTDATDAGAFLVVAANGLEALRTIDAHGPVLENSFPADRVDFISNTGKRLGDRPTSGSGDGGLGSVTLKRATLARVLREEALRRGVRIEHGKRLLAVHTSPDGRIVGSFADGGRAVGDVLIGADGIHSLIRRLIDAGAPRPRYTGQHTVCGYTRDADSPPALDAYTMIFGKQAFFGCTTAPDGEVWWFCNAPAEEMSRAELAAVTAEQWRERLLTLFAEDNTPAADLVRATGDSIVATAAYDIVSTPTWSEEGMVIVGDAAHACAPNAAQGASMAIEDGVVLAKCLRDLRSPRPAFAAYEALRRERVEKVAAASAGMARRMAPGPVARALRDVTMPRKLDRAGGGAPDWLTGYRIDWDEPVAGTTAHRRR